MGRPRPQCISPDLRTLRKAKSPLDGQSVSRPKAPMSMVFQSYALLPTPDGERQRGIRSELLKLPPQNVSSGSLTVWRSWGSNSAAHTRYSHQPSGGQQRCLWREDSSWSRRSSSLRRTLSNPGCLRLRMRSEIRALPTASGTIMTRDPRPVRRLTMSDMIVG